MKRGLAIIGVVLSVLFCSFGYNNNVNAEEMPGYRLQVSPTGYNLGELKPGGTYEGSFQVQNTGAKTFRFAVSIAPYSVVGLTYEPDLVQKTQYTEMANWLTIEETTGEVQAGARKTVNYTVTVPRDTPGKSQSVALIVTMETPEQQAGIGMSIAQQVATVVYANVEGNTRKTGAVLENSVPMFILNQPLKTTAKVENTGNVNTAATFTLEVRTLGDELVYTNVTEEKGVPMQVMFPETEFVRETEWASSPQLGLYKVKQIVQIYDEVSEVERVVFLCPIWFLILAAVFVLAIGYCIWERVHTHKKKAQLLREKAEREERVAGRETEGR